MPEIKKVNVQGTLYDFEDSTARNSIVQERYRLPFGFEGVEEVTLITNKTLAFSETAFNFGENTTYAGYEKFTAYATSDNPLTGEAWTGQATTDFTGRRFIITWDGTDYLCNNVTSHRISSKSATEEILEAVYLLGNETLIKAEQMYVEHANIPFAFILGRWSTSSTVTRTFRILTNDTSATHTFSLKELVATSHTNLPSDLSDGTDVNGVRQIYNGTGVFSSIINRGLKASGNYSLAEGYGTIATESGSHAEGHFTQALGKYSHAEGYNTITQAEDSHAEGNDNIASGNYAHVEGRGNVASGRAAHAEGGITTASGSCSHARGQHSTAAAKYSTAAGSYSSIAAAAESAFASGYYASAIQPAQFIIGYGNNPQADSIFEIGNGLDKDGNPGRTGTAEPVTRQNAFRVTQAGVAIAQTGLQIGSTGLTEAELSTIKGFSTSKVNEPASEGTNGQVLATDGNGGRIWTTVQGGGGGEPAAYLKSASTSGNTLTLVNKDNTTVTYTPTETYTGTVTSVGAGTGLSISGTASVNPTISIASDCKLPTILEWNSKADSSDLTAHTGNSTIHVTASDKSTWNGKQNALTAGTNITLSGSTISAKNQVDVVNGTSPESQVEIWIDESKSYGELDPTQIVQTTGQDTLKVMSQKAVTDALASSGEPSAYIKNATTSGNTLTLTKKDDSTVTYTPTEQYQGTVTSVGAGTGLNISGTASVNPTVNVASTHKLPTTSEWSGKQDNLVFGTAYSATTNKAATIADIRAIFSLNGTELTITTTTSNSEE